jgi:hypothetical protein
MNFVIVVRIVFVSYINMTSNIVRRSLNIARALIGIIEFAIPSKNIGILGLALKVENLLIEYDYWLFRLNDKTSLKILINLILTNLYFLTSWFITLELDAIFRAAKDESNDWTSSSLILLLAISDATINSIFLALASFNNYAGSHFPTSIHTF